MSVYLSLSHEEFNGLLGEIVQHMLVVLWRNDLLHQPHLTLGREMCVVCVVCVCAWGGGGGGGGGVWV